MRLLHRDFFEAREGAVIGPRRWATGRGPCLNAATSRYPPPLRRLPHGCVVGIDSRSRCRPRTSSGLKAGPAYVLGTTAGPPPRDCGAGSWAVRLGSSTPPTLGGVNLFIGSSAKPLALLAKCPDTTPLPERHHRQKKDAPSGTAKVLSGIVSSSGGRRRSPPPRRAPSRGQLQSRRCARGNRGEHTVASFRRRRILLDPRPHPATAFRPWARSWPRVDAPRTGFHSSTPSSGPARGLISGFPSVIIDSHPWALLSWRRLVRGQEVGGSIPPRSTTNNTSRAPLGMVAVVPFCYHPHGNSPGSHSLTATSILTSSPEFSVPSSRFGATTPGSPSAHANSTPTAGGGTRSP